MHGETAAPLRARAHVGGVSEHFRKRHRRLDDLRGPAQLDAFDMTAPRVQIAHHRAVVFFRHHHFHRHDRLEQHRLGLADGFFDGQRAGHLKGHFRRVHVVVSAVVERHLDVRHREPGQDSAFQRFLDAGFGGLDVSFGTRPPVISSTNSKPPPGSGSMRIFTWPYCPWPPVCLMWRPSASEFLRMVSRYATCGLPTLAPTPNSRIMRSTMISKCNSPIPERMVCPVSGSVFTLKVGSSWASFWMAIPIFSWSALVFGSTAS